MVFVYLFCRFIWIRRIVIIYEHNFKIKQIISGLIKLCIWTWKFRSLSRNHLSRSFSYQEPVAFNAHRGHWNTWSKAVPGKFHRYCGHNKRKNFQDRTNFHNSGAWQIVLIFNTASYSQYHQQDAINNISIYSIHLPSESYFLYRLNWKNTSFICMS